MSLDQNFPERLKYARINKKLSKAELARKSGVTQQQIYRYEAGISIPRDDIVAKLVAALGVAYEWLAHGSNVATNVTISESRETIASEETDLMYKYLSKLFDQIEVEEEKLAALYQETQNPITKDQILKAQNDIQRMFRLSSRIVTTLSILKGRNDSISKSLSEYEESYRKLKSEGKLESYQEDSRKKVVSYLGDRIPESLAKYFVSNPDKFSSEIIEDYKSWFVLKDIPDAPIKKYECINELESAIDLLIKYSIQFEVNEKCKDVINTIKKYLSDISFNVYLTIPEEIIKIWRQEREERLSKFNADRVTNQHKKSPPSM